MEKSELFISFNKCLNVCIVLRHDVLVLPSVALLSLTQLLKVQRIDVSRDARREQGIFLFPKTCMPTMELTRFLMRCVPVFFWC